MKGKTTSVSNFGIDPFGRTKYSATGMPLRGRRRIKVNPQGPVLSYLREMISLNHFKPQ